MLTTTCSQASLIRVVVPRSWPCMQSRLTQVTWVITSTYYTQPPPSTHDVSKFGPTLLPLCSPSTYYTHDKHEHVVEEDASSQSCIIKGNKFFCLNGHRAIHALVIAFTTMAKGEKLMTINKIFGISSPHKDANFWVQSSQEQDEER